MPYFSDDDINEAKRRVREMQSRAGRYTASGQSKNDFSPEEKSNKADLKNSFDENNNPHNTAPEGQGDTSAENGGGIFNLFNNSDSSQIIILALIMVLSREGADNMLIFALLYLLL